MLPKKVKRNIAVEIPQIRKYDLFFDILSSVCFLNCLRVSGLCFFSIGSFMRYNLYSLFLVLETFLTVSENATKKKLPKPADIKDGLFKIMLFSQIKILQQ